MANSYVGELMALTMGLSGIEFLWILGSPYCIVLLGELLSCRFIEGRWGWRNVRKNNLQNTAKEPKTTPTTTIRQKLIRSLIVLNSTYCMFGFPKLSSFESWLASIISFPLKSYNRLPSRELI